MKKRRLVKYLFLAYCILLFSLTLLNFSDTFGQIGHKVRLQPINFIAAISEHGIQSIRGYFLNVLLFIPMGFFLPIVFPEKMRRWMPAAMTILGTTIGIEFIQYFIGRYTDVNDVIANFIGGFGAYLVCRLISYVI